MPIPMSDPRSGPGLPDDLATDQGEMRQVTWGEVGLGNIVRDKVDRLHLVTKEGAGWVQLEAVKDGATAAMRKPASINNVWIYVPSETECRILLDKELGARLLRQVEDREHTKARALTWRVEPVKRGVVSLRDHIDFLHGVNVDDVLRRHNGTAANPSNKERKKASLEELVMAHDEMHADPDLWPHAKAHHHG